MKVIKLSWGDVHEVKKIIEMILSIYMDAEHGIVGRNVSQAHWNIEGVEITLDLDLEEEEHSRDE